MSKQNPRHKVRGVYLFPNMLTTAGLFAAFYAIVAAFKGFYESAAVAIFVAMIADAFDGRVARMTNTESPFGAQYDSLADMVSFGIAPALVIYAYALQNIGKPGWLSAFIYTACGALRLARFNTQLSVTSKKYFTGLPIPAAAAILASYVWFCYNYELGVLWLDYIVAGLVIVIAVLMVSEIRYYSFKEIDLKGRVPFLAVVLIVLVMVTVTINPPVVLLLSFGGYAISGPLMTLIRIRRISQHKNGK